MEPQQKKPTATNSSAVRQKLIAAKSALGLRDLNISTAVTGHEKINKIAAQNPKQQFSQMLNRLSQAERKNYVAATTHIPSDSLDNRVSMSAFRRQLQALKSSKPLMNSFDPSEEDQIVEAIAGFKDENNPPVMIVLQRKGIRIFPDGKKVAMYHNKQLGLVITIPYAGTGNSPGEVIPGANIQMEEVEDIMESLDQVAAYASQEQPKALAKHMKFADGSKLKVSHGAAKAIHLVHGALNDENKKKFADMLTTPKGFEKAAHFALSKVQYKIGGDK